jgi:hypothetical protein
VQSVINSLVASAALGILSLCHITSSANIFCICDSHIQNIFDLVCVRPILASSRARAKSCEFSARGSFSGSQSLVGAFCI